MKTIYFILLSVLFVAAGQLMLKQGLINLGELHFDLAHLSETTHKVVTSPLIVLGITLFALSSILWLTALSRAELSFAYPLLSIGYATVAIASIILFKEHLSLTRFFGILIIILGVAILSLNGGEK